MPDKDEKRVVLQRGRAEEEWHTPGYVPALPPKPLLKRLPRVRLPDWTEETWAQRLRQGVIVLVVVAVLLLALQGSFRGFKADGLSMEPTIIAPPDVSLPNVNMAQYGDPLAKIGPPSNGPGSGGGIGSGSGGGVGPGKGGGFGLKVAMRVEDKGLAQGDLAAFVQEAHGKICPYSHAIRGNVDVEFEVIGNQNPGRDHT